MKKLLLSATLLVASMSANAQANLGFETWATGSPASWTWYNGAPVNILANPALGGTCQANGVAATPCIQGTTGAPQGTSYVKLTSVTRAGSTNPQFDAVYGGTIVQTIATTAKPTSVSFKYTYARQNMDSAVVFIQGTKWNGSSRTVVGQGVKVINANAANWTTVTNSPIQWIGTPDTIQITISSSKGDVLTNSLAPQDNSILEVDDLSFVAFVSTASLEESEVSNVFVYPNPATTVLNIDSKEEVATISVMTTDGKIVATSSSAKNINVELLNAGMYIYQVTSVSGKVNTGNFVKN
ncbi:T9SS type A sorting domain-containing protein [Fluviicola taffensis]|uniref:Secretion system C-terminal sorting domain-containing protein n=1 Tax=Fluviicola taffensis (strain DSM 16823 / NCIMB 13979 / RW262) TaxID=755732 RepID=F2IHV2_FLUTR|nr:T9SS type A sorting domain-containing protein [Fluviicola taffensis]AEA45911.1 hypothetical protein Fluta_3947 [Fluviicola taffensis DSM 16823]